jgi:hypothetical protein
LYHFTGSDLFSFKNDNNKSGSFIKIGSSSYGSTSSIFLNSVANNKFFDGKVSQIRFWSKNLDIEETKEHIKNPFTLGVQNPLVNFNFITNVSESFERNRIDLSLKQEISSSDNSGQIIIQDFSQNNYNFTGSSFPLTSSIFSYETIFYGQLGTSLYDNHSKNKIRIRSFEKPEEEYNNSLYSTAPLYYLNNNEEVFETNRFSVDFSIIKGLNEDIIKLISDLENFNDYLGKPEYSFGDKYPDLEKLKNIYFNRLITNVNLRSFYSFYKWFDSNIGEFINQLLPKRTRFRGTLSTGNSLIFMIEYGYSS